MPSGPISRRKLLQISGTSVALAGLTGCLGGDSSDTTQAPDNDDEPDSDGDDNTATDEPETTLAAGELTGETRFGNPDASNTLSYWNTRAGSHRSEAFPDMSEEYKKVMVAWARDNPEFKANMQFQTDVGQFETKLLQSAAAGNPPDMSQIDSAWLPRLYDQLQPLSDVIPDPDDWFPFVKEVATHNGEWVAVWKNTGLRTLFYRQDMMDKYNDGDPPATWDELVSVGSAIADNEDMNGHIYHGGRYEGTTFDHLGMYWAQGVDLVDDNGAPIIGEDENYDALLSVFRDYYKATVESGASPQQVASYSSYTRLRKEAMNGNAAMFIGGNWQSSSIESNADSEEEANNWKVGKLPMREEGIHATGVGGWTEGVFTDDENKQAVALDYVSRYGDAETMGDICASAGFLPTRRSIYEDHEYFANNEYMQQYKKLLEDGHVRPGFPIYSTISNQWQIAAGKVLTGQTSPKEAVDEMVKNVEAEYEA